MNFWPCCSTILLQVVLAEFALFLVARQEHLGDGIAADLRQLGVEQPLRFGPHQLVGNRRENARAVARVGFAAASAAVIHVAQRLGGVADDAVAAHALDVGDEADAAAILLVGRVVQPVLLAASPF